MPGDVIVHVDPPRQHGQPPQVVRCSAGMLVMIQPQDLAVLHYDTNILQSVASAIQNRSSLNDDGAGLVTLRVFCFARQRNQLWNKCSQGSDRQTKSQDCVFHGTCIVASQGRNQEGQRPNQTMPTPKAS